jgi:hypothetical protein
MIGVLIALGGIALCSCAVLAVYIVLRNSMY